MNRIEIKEEAKQLTARYFSQFWKSFLIIFVSTLVLTALLGIFFGGSFAFIIQILLLPLYIGYTGYILKLVRGEEAVIADIFQSYKNIGLILLTAVISYVTVVCGYLLLIIPGIILTYSYVMVGYLLADINDNNVTNANRILRKSQEMMNGYKFDYFIFQLSFIGWQILCAITFGIAYIYVIPYFTFANIVYYEKLKELRRISN